MGNAAGKKGHPRGPAKREDSILSEEDTANLTPGSAEAEEAFTEGNRVLLSLNLLLNNIGKNGISALRKMLSVNSAITRCLLDDDEINSNVL